MEKLCPPSWALGLFVVCVAITNLHQASAAPGPGWLSIDCGATAPYDDDNGIHWVPDTDYVSGGIAVTVKVPFNSSWLSNPPQLKALRYFPDVSRVCYNIPINRSQPYLLRWTTYHGGYDSRSTFLLLFSFETFINDVYTVTDGIFWNEAIFRLPQDNVHFCLYRPPWNPTQDPFLSSLELRPLSSTMYTAAQDDTYILYYQDRFDFGAPDNSCVRYPGDVYDRYWPGASSNFTNVENFAGASSVLDSGLAVDEPPPAVMNTALIGVANTPMELPLDYGVSYTNFTFLMNFFFAEMQTNISKAQPRVFDIIVNDVVMVPNFDVYSTALNVLYKPVEVPNIQSSSPNGTFTVKLSPAPTSTLTPIVNALEVYVIMHKIPGTYSTDASAIEGVKKVFGLESWTGDPCLMSLPYDWLSCNLTGVPSTPPRVTAVKLSNYNLTGTIPEVLRGLTNLTSLHLDNNKLTGSIPDWLVSLPSLRELDLHNNDLSGTLPEYNKNNLDLRIDGNPNLCIPSATNPCPINGKAKKASGVYIIIGVVVGVVLAIAAAVTLYYICSVKRRKKQSLQIISTGSGAKRGSRYTMAQVLAATKNYQTLLGRGGFGPVYYGKLASGQEVAVKVASKGSNQGSKEFINEIDLLTRIHHKNLVSLVGYCDQDDSLMLLYEFMAQGTLQEHLYGKAKTDQDLVLDWNTRLQIGLGAAQGLEYLHVGCNPAIFHRDVKSNNILLDDRLVPKVADFGLSKSTDSNEDVSHVSTQVKGTFGYIDPEYFVSNQLTDKSDVYGLGIVLLELICARPPFVPSLPEEERRIDDWVRPYLESNDVDQIVDPALGGHYNINSVLKVVNLAMKSLEPKGVHRPNMSTVVHELREALQIEIGSDSSSSIPPALHQHRAAPDFTFDSSLVQSSNPTSDVQFSSDNATKE
ncbi:hypothetical protein KC19_8G181600 [Ceratodon purpureus]|uniref:Protein kinase domain-containing protein n=1 Tax=Ceratodon purpureus TaxID=3225 RepID=A0A8T0GZQ4_CERPU|nr:hypothetical protein KC19_8G181600 [Ceratodon purpureus]